VQSDVLDRTSIATTMTSGTVIARLSGKKAMRSGVGWGLVFGVYVATQALTYASSYKSEAARRLLVKEFGSNPGISALVGPAFRIDTVSGFTVWKCLTVLAITGSVWGILTATRLLRGEEEAGRWEVLLAGRTTRRGSAVQALFALASGLGALFVTTGVLIVALGRSSKVDVAAGGALFFTMAIVAGPAMFLAIGALTSQLASTRRQAAGAASAVLGASYAIRMAADSVAGLGWLRWATPLGWVEELKPLTSPNTWPVVPIVAWIAVCGLITVLLAGRRDLGASTLRDHASRAPRVGLLNGPVVFAFRLLRPTLLAWTVSIIAYGLLLGTIAKSGGQAITSSPALRLVFERLGVSGAQAYLGIALLLMAVTMGFIAAGQVSAARTEESSGRLEHLLVRPLSRRSWFVGRTTLATGVLVVGGVLAGLSTWVGAASDHAGVSFTSMLEAGVNVVPPALVILGVGLLFLGVAPRLSVPVTYAVLVWSLLIEITSGIAVVNHWVLDTSVFHQMAAAPSVHVDWAANLIMVLLGALVALAGVDAFTRRDLKGE
jgi:ABC-2 type transport system permease protein